MRIEHVKRRLVGSVRKPVPQQITGSPTMRLGTIKTVTAGAAADGNAAVVVTVNGNDMASAYNASYTPVVGHLVMVFLNDGAPAIGWHVVGIPSI